MPGNDAALCRLFRRQTELGASTSGCAGVLLGRSSRALAVDRLAGPTKVEGAAQKSGVRCGCLPFGLGPGHLRGDGSNRGLVVGLLAARRPERNSLAGAMGEADSSR